MFFPGEGRNLDEVLGKVLVRENWKKVLLEVLLTLNNNYDKYFLSAYKSSSKHNEQILSSFHQMCILSLKSKYNVLFQSIISAALPFQSQNFFAPELCKLVPLWNGIHFF